MIVYTILNRNTKRLEALVVDTNPHKKYKELYNSTGYCRFWLEVRVAVEWTPPYVLGFTTA